MSDLKKIEWVGPTRVIPKVGVAEKGSVLDLPCELADKIISQGLAKPVVKSIKDKGDV